MARCDGELLAHGLAVLARLQVLGEWRLDRMLPSSWNALVVKSIERLLPLLSAVISCDFVLGLERLQARRPASSTGARWLDQPR